MAYYWEDLSDDELGARLRQHGCRLDEVGRLVALRDDPVYAAAITEVLGR